MKPSAGGAGRLLNGIRRRIPFASPHKDHKAHPRSSQQGNATLSPAPAPQAARPARDLESLGCSSRAWSTANKAEAGGAVSLVSSPSVTPESHLSVQPQKGEMTAAGCPGVRWFIYRPKGRNQLPASAKTFQTALLQRDFAK